MSTMAGRVEALREKRGFTQVGLCKSISLKQSSYSHIERGKTTAKNIKADTLYRLARRLETYPEYLLYGTGDGAFFRIAEIYTKLGQEGRDELLGRAISLYERLYPNTGPKVEAPKRRKREMEPA